MKNRRPIRADLLLALTVTMTCALLALACESGSGSRRGGDAVTPTDTGGGTSTDTGGGQGEVDEQGKQTIEAASMVAGGVEAAAIVARALSELDLADPPSSELVETAAGLLDDFFGDCVTITTAPAPALGATVAFAPGGCTIPTTSISLTGSVSLVIEADGSQAKARLTFDQLSALGFSVDGALSLAAGNDVLTATISNLSVSDGTSTATVDAEGTFEVQSPILHPTRIAFSGQVTATVDGLGLSVAASQFEKSFQECYAGSGTLTVDTVGISTPTLTITFGSDSKETGVVQIQYGVLSTSYTLPSRGCGS